MFLYPAQKVVNSGPVLLRFIENEVKLRYMADAHTLKQLALDVPFGRVNGRNGLLRLVIITRNFNVYTRTLVVRRQREMLYPAA